MATTSNTFAILQEEIRRERSENKYLPEADSFYTHKRFCEEYMETVLEEFKKHLSENEAFFSTSYIKRTEYIISQFGENLTPFDFITQSEQIGVKHTSSAFFANIMDLAMKGAFHRIPSEPCTLPLESSRSVSPNLEVDQPIQHQSEQLLPNLTSSKRTNDDQDMEVDQNASSTSHDNSRKNKNVLEKNKNKSHGSKSHDQNSSSKPKTKRNKNQRPGPRSIKILTGYQGQNKERIKDILVYNVPSTWTDNKILNELQSWGKMIQLCSKIQRKY